MILLALDTAGPACAVALAEDAGAGLTVLAREEEEIGRGHAERLFPMIDGVLASAGRSYADIGRIAATVGPGSFTGVRIGVAAARGLALALKVEAVGIDVLEAMVEAARSQAGSGVIAALLAAGRGNVCLRIETGEGAVLLSSVRVAEEEAPAILAPHIGSGLVLTGSAASAIVGSMEPSAMTPAILGVAASADIATVAAMAAAGRGESPPVPLYLRPPDARPQAGKALARR
ncbi:tRNA (adenosine(37)-N6)-threonylcarbamoyltransferase complex dimerization subunit type 1 TsaB [Afifella sp. IM 167]|uniref:tRNA (adenosine(37)-N6)-threonylcarbamoyltransferase complex dimerization subunit type 1 TsaB n=1 Tax=Afifella sp. IM 167 TaxID=2033586 RepID=UPI001CCECD39|nr:tRNA (adenosine(37)-N6)-threonylcarbamoyltransferase complex dimerization subunit type 1 TsaB [Afifella sp. IM 167]MBZ8133723.1 tRNA (adenosine(37)-N6)-threonylcarbamoyltransferase complex dimerization subunit type 1 TsaB [Afifella sp. IM 167]